MDNLAPSHKLLHSYCTMSHTKFEAQGKDEQVYILVRAHPITQIFPLINAFFFIFLLFFANFFFPSFLSIIQILFINVFILVVVFNNLWFCFLNWYFNVGIVTNKQIIDVDFHVILYKEISYTQLQHIEDVTAKSGGFFESFFDFGNIFIQTAGTEVNTEFLNIPHPSGVSKIINSLLEAHEQPPANP